MVLADRGYSPAGELYDACMALGIPVTTWNAAHRNDTLMLKRYDCANQNVHPSSISQKSWKQIKNMNWTKSQSNSVFQELHQCYSSGEWYGEVGTQIKKKLLNKSTLIKNLQLDTKVKTIGIFPHIFWDATFAWGTDLFQSYEDWFVETVKAACGNSAVNWVIKVHPANIVKNHRDGVYNEHSEIGAIRREIGELPPHVKLLKADTKISTLSLLEVIDACVTVRGTIGLETACFGKPVFTAGTGRYDSLGFTIDSTTRNEFLNRLANIQKIKPLSIYQKELAVKYAWGLLIARPVYIKIFKMRFKQNQTADLAIDFLIKNKSRLNQFSDLKAIASWIISEEEDFINKINNK